MVDLNDENPYSERALTGVSSKQQEENAWKELAKEWGYWCQWIEDTVSRTFQNALEDSTVCKVDGGVPGPLVCNAPAA